ncbi:hypothetical protein [Acidianus manzaensis]|uniref:Succinate dehydrogenase n=1 Tax=Acidianus manzaensis TaxID=282676 RepID=A0A1W6JYM8_9CREN|nr:hypothetical protein [Acidianus manzaensis]ARM75320.1 hypothetical protein B6F84_04250 [Acidianus manzaensis]
MKQWIEFGWNIERYLALLQMATGWIIFGYLIFHVIFVYELARGMEINDSFLMPVLVIFGAILTFHITNGIRILLIETGFLIPKNHGESYWLNYRSHNQYKIILMILLLVSLLISYMAIFK